MIQYAGVDTLIPTPEVDEYISRYLDREFMRFWNRPGNGPCVGASAPFIPVMNWQKEFSPRVNKLIWPTGASRWSSMLLLVTSSQLESIKQLTDLTESTTTRSIGQQLVIADSEFGGTAGSDTFTRDVLAPPEGDTPAVYGTSIALSTEMYALEARPVSLPYTWNGEAWVETSESTLWLLPIVDYRWFGQWFTLSSHDEWETWEDVIEKCIQKLGSPDVSAVNASYGTPPATLTDGLYYANAPEIADSLAHMVGQRVARRIDGTIVSRTASDAQTSWDNNWTGDGSDAYDVWQIVAGGEYTNKHKAAATVPEKVQVVFSEGVGYPRTTSGSGATQWGASGTAATMFAAYSVAESPDDFSLQRAKDYVSWLSRKSDVVFAGVKAWRMTGFEDFVLWSVCPVSGITTRVVTHPENLAALPAGSGSTSNNCRMTYELRLMWNPTEATITIHLKYNDVTEDIVITRGMTALEIQDELNTHSEIIAAGEGCSVGGAGHLYNSNMVVWLPEGATIEGFSAVMTTREYSPTAEFYINICSCRGVT